jgi:hypothetical protein
MPGKDKPELGGVMFIQYIKAKTADEQGVRAAMDRWDTDLKPGADGYLGTTSGFLDDGTFIALARFSSAEAARRNSDRPEQGQWWAEMEKNFDGPAEFIDSSDVEEWLDGGSDSAAFVQVMVGTSPDVQALRAGGRENLDRLREARPEIIGGYFAIHGDNGYVQTAYFTSEGEARQGESGEPPEDIKHMIEERMRLMGDVTYYDLHQPILQS